MPQTKNRKKTNFMMDQQVLATLEELIPTGKRSDFVNESMKAALTRFGREKAAEEMDKLAKKHALKISTEESIKLKNYGRR